MPIRKLSTTDAFVVVDLEGAPAAGQVRCAPKILQGGAKDLARSLTYAFATFEMRRSGASAGINAAGDDRGGAIAAFVEELTPDVADGRLSLHAGKGVTPEELAPLDAVDDRAELAAHPVGGDDTATFLAALGPVLAAEHALGGLEGKRVAIDGFSEHGPALAEAAVERGAAIVAISTTAGCLLGDGLDPSELREGWASDGAGLVGEEAPPAWKIFATEADVLLAGSKMGAIDHDTAANLAVAAVVPHQPLPYTTRALAVMVQAGIVAVPDFVSTAGPLFAWWPVGEQSVDAAVAAASDAITGALADAAQHEHSWFMGSCARAEAFLGTWQDTLPFGRPLAS